MFAKTTLRQILQDEQGATAVEYGLIVALIVIAMITTLQGLATETIDMWLNIETRVANASSLP